MDMNNKPVVPIVPTAEQDVPVYNLTQEDGTAPASSQFQPPMETFDARTDGLVAGFTSTRFAAALLLIIAAGNLHAEAPGIYYITAGTILFASKIIEFLAKCIDMLSFIIGTMGALIIVIGGVMAVGNNEINLDTVGIMWIIAGLCLFVGHSYSLLITYGRVNQVISTSKLFAAIGAMLFVMGGITMYSLDEVNAGNVYTFANFFTSGGVCYMVHAITMGSGHDAVLQRVRAQEYQTYMSQQQPQPEAV